MRYTSKRYTNTRFWSFSARLFTAFGAVAVIAVVSLSIYSLTQQHNQQSNASASTTLSFSQSQTQVNPGNPITLDVNMNPGNNFVSLVTLVIDYDQTAVTPSTTNGIAPNTQAFPQTLDGPSYNTCNGNQCTMSISLSVGSDPTKAIKAPTTIATVNFTPVAPNGTTQLTFDNQTQVFSVAPGDQANENVLSTTNPATITIGQGNPTSVTPFPQTTDTPTPSQSQPTPSITCIPRPPCLDATPRCQIAEPAQGWCPPTITPPQSSITPQPTGPIVCKERDNDSDKDIEMKLKKLYQHLDNIEDKLRRLIKHKELSKAQKAKFLDIMESNLSQTDTTSTQLENELNIGTNTNGGCMGNFDPNNPNVVNDCNHPNAVGSTPLETFWNTILNKFQGLFSGGQ